MGYDITFHSITNEELDTFFFEVIAFPKLAKKRAAALTNDKENRSPVQSAWP